jgi:hypothetical protein
MRRADAYLRVLKAVIRSFDAHEEFHQTPTRFFFLQNKIYSLSLCSLNHSLMLDLTLIK